MTARVISKVRNGIEHRWILLTSLASAGFFILGQFSRTDAVLTVFLLTAISISIVYKTLNKFMGEKEKSTSRNSEFIQDLETVLLMVVSSGIIIQLTGGSSSAFYPVNYAISAFLTAYFSAGVAVAGLAAMFALEFFRENLQGKIPMETVIIHGMLMFVFAALGYLALRLEISRLRFSTQKGLERDLSRIRQDARDFRLIGTSIANTPRTREEAQSLLSRASVENIHSNLYFLINLISESLDLKTCALLWFDEGREILKIKEASTRSRVFYSGDFPAMKGPVGYVVKNLAAINLGDFSRRFSDGAIPFYSGHENIGSFAAVPVIEGGQLRGILCADREINTPFSESEMNILSGSSEQILRILITERAFHSIEKSKFEQEKFFQASMMMNEALGVEQVVSNAFESVNSITGVSNMGIFTTAAHGYKLVGNEGKIFSKMKDREFHPERSIFSLVMENRHHLPVNGELRDRRQMVLTPDVDFSDMASVLILPLIVRDRVMGGFVLADEKTGIFNNARIEMLGVIANQVAIALQNALMYEKLEQMATTDGLTGLTNHRTFQEKFSEMLARSERMGTSLSVILTDIDKFKSVNDTYGHPVGDVVIKRVASILKKTVRTIDLAARYGGEEFAVVLESTDSEGAMALAERIRQEVENQVFDSEKGEFKASLSLGVATFPVEGNHKQQLIEKSDKALYYAKQHGRNQSVYFGDIK